MPGEAVKGTRDAVAEAFDKLSTEDADASVDISTETGNDLQDTTSESGESTEQATTDAEAGSTGARTRDASGRFVKGANGESVEEAPKGKLAAVPDLKEVAKELEADAQDDAPVPEVEEDPLIGKAPQSWRAHVRENWKDLPKPIREEIHRLDKEARVSATRASKEGEYANRVRETVNPYEHMFRAEGVEPLQGVGNLLQRYAVLQSGPIQHRVAILGDLIKNFIGVDEGSLTALAHHLHGGEAAPANRGPAAVTPQDVEGIIERRWQARQMESDRQAAAQVVRDFQATKPEFLTDVKSKMGAILGVMEREKNGARLTLQDLKEAYDQACQLDKDVKSVLDQRRRAKEAKEARSTNGSSTDRAVRAAASSGKSEQAGGGKTPIAAKDTRAEVTRQFAASEARSRGKK